MFQPIVSLAEQFNRALVRKWQPVMRFSSVCCAMLLAACGSPTSQTEATEPVPKQTEQGKVHYYDFSIERITGLHENEVEQYGSKYCINRLDFEQLLRMAAEQVASEQYNRLDVRAKIVFGNRTYFIDRTGAVRSGLGYAALDKKKFAAVLRSDGEC
jgi:hypothetical protein